VQWQYFIIVNFIFLFNYSKNKSYKEMD